MKFFSECIRSQFSFQFDIIIAQQPDLGKVGAEMHRAWSDKHCARGSQKKTCLDMKRMDDWLEQACAQTHTSSCHVYCNISTFAGMSKLSFTYLMHTFGRRMLNYPSVKSHPIFAEIEKFLFKENYFDVPLPKATEYFLKDVWHKYNGDA